MESQPLDLQEQTVLGFDDSDCFEGASLVAQSVKKLPAMQEILV